MGRRVLVVLGALTIRVLALRVVDCACEAGVDELARDLVEVRERGVPRRALAVRQPRHLLHEVLHHLEIVAQAAAQATAAVTAVAAHPHLKLLKARVERLERLEHELDSLTHTRHETRRILLAQLEIEGEQPVRRLVGRLDEVDDELAAVVGEVVADDRAGGALRLAREALLHDNVLRLGAQRVDALADVLRLA